MSVRSRKHVPEVPSFFREPQHLTLGIGEAIPFLKELNLNGTHVRTRHIVYRKQGGTLYVRIVPFTHTVSQHSPMKIHHEAESANRSILSKVRHYHGTNFPLRQC